jgi:hypothetical protein
MVWVGGFGEGQARALEGCVPRDTTAPNRALKQNEEAIEHYIARIKLGGWEEERFVSAYNIADLVMMQHLQGELVSPQVCWGEVK